MNAAVDLTDLPLPHRRQEHWKYTDLRSYAKQLPNSLSTSIGVLPSTEIQALLQDSVVDENHARLVFIDGVYMPEHSEASLHLDQHESAGDDATQAELKPLAAITPGQHYTLQLGADQTKPVHLLFASSRQADVLHKVHLDIVFRPGSAVSVVEEHLGGRQGISLSTINISLEQDAQAHWLRVQHTDAQHTQLARQAVAIGARADLHQVHVEWGARLSRLDSTITLDAPESKIGYFALTGINAHQHVDHQVQVRHESPHGTSHLRAWGIVGDAARHVFSGKIYVARDAQKTDSDQLLRNLLLSDRAEVDAKPELEIYADDVRCAHGSTVGRLDDQALFYLRSRGLGLEEARRLLMLSFAEHILSEIQNEDLREAIRGPLAQHLSLRTPA